MIIKSAQAEPATDRRVRRTRAALIRAALALVGERGTSAVPVSELADAADVSRQVVYQHFGDRDALLLAAAIDLARRELLPAFAAEPGPSGGRAPALAMARHFAAHRRFYRALLTGSCAFALTRGLSELMLPVNREMIRHVHGPGADPQTVDDVAAFLTGGGAAFFNTWVVEGPEPLDPEEFTDRLMRMVALLTATTALEEHR